MAATFSIHVKIQINKILIWKLSNFFRLDLHAIFDTDRDQKYVLLIFEPESCYLGRQV